MTANQTVLGDARAIIDASLREVLPDEAVRRALKNRAFDRPVTLFAIGKAAWRMARAAYDTPGNQIVRGVVITKYGHSEGGIGPLEIFEAGHPVPDDHVLVASERAAQMALALTERDIAVFLISGGGSSLFEMPCEGVTLADIADVTRQLLARGADITEINSVRKRLSRVKGGRFAEMIAPARLLTVVLSDVLGDRLDVIASGPAHPDQSTCAQAQGVAEKYHLTLSPAARAALGRETPKALAHVETVVAGNVERLCDAAARAARALGYEARVMDTALSCEARDAGAMIAGYARDLARRSALIWGGETVVHVRGNGMGGRNQELALSAAEGIAGIENTCVFALGSDGTDGPTDAAGGIVTGDFYAAAGAENVRKYLENNDSYALLSARGALIKTGPTGTNVNDLYVLMKE